MGVLSVVILMCVLFAYLVHCFVVVVCDFFFLFLKKREILQLLECYYVRKAETD